ncbi:hypothetical protein [Bacillus thuringiensis]|uniref:hypothetical protein n=1 Tax=Bacillus thuringiensis TaxID=1428 RepID=UPI003B9868E8
MVQAFNLNCSLTFKDTLNVYITRHRKNLTALGIENAVKTVHELGYRLKVNWSE